MTLPPIGAALLASAAVGKPGRDRWFTRWWMRLTAVLGFAGVGFHAYGVVPQHGRLAQLEPERAQRPAAAGAAEFHRPRAGRPRRARADGGPSRCLSQTIRV